MPAINFYGPLPPAMLTGLRLGGYCPHCKTASRYTLTTVPINNTLQSDKATSFVASYMCDNCMEPIPVKWEIDGWKSNIPTVKNPVLISPAIEPFNFDHTPIEVQKEVKEALDCLSVNAFHGFASMCRRSIQAICTDLGSDATSKVKRQIEEMVDIAGMDDEWKELAIQIMLTGHDGAHPHLPEVDVGRAAVLLDLLRDLTYQLYTRPGNIRKAAELRQEAIAK